MYSGSLYQRLSLRVPRAVVFDQIGGEGEHSGFCSFEQLYLTRSAVKVRTQGSTRWSAVCEQSCFDQIGGKA